MPDDPKVLIAWFRRNASNRTRAELANLFEVCGWKDDRQSGKEGRVWIKGVGTFVFSARHDKHVSPGVVRQAIREILRIDPQWGGDDDKSD